MTSTAERRYLYNAGILLEYGQHGSTPPQSLSGLGKNQILDQALKQHDYWLDCLEVVRKSG